MSNILAITYEGAVAITPSDSVTFAKPFAAFHTGAGGTATVLTPRGQQVAIPNLPAGVIYPLAFVKMFATGTNIASGILGLQAMPYTGAP